MNVTRTESGRTRWGALVTLLLLSAVLAAGWLYQDYRSFSSRPLATAGNAASFEVPRGAALPAILAALNPLPANTLYWRILVREMGVGSRLHAGEYALTPGLTPRTLLEKMAAGDVIQHHFTIVEGWTFKQLRLALAQEPGLAQTLQAIDDAEIMRRLGAGGAAAEGWFLPETYSYVKGTSDLDILRRAHEAVLDLLARAWPTRAPDLPLESDYQALILASIVERETARAEERSQIARVFLHRLQIGMKLQTDPSVIYGLGASYDGKIHRRDLDTDTPYNSYTRAGLPPTPIALPGRAAIEATLHPAPTEALYFVARGDGTHEFSADLEAHNRAVSKFQLHKNP